MRFDKVIILGSGKIACDIVQLLSKRLLPHYMLAIESKNNELSFFAKICKFNDIQYLTLSDADKIEDCLILEAIKNKSILVISANNRYIFSKKILTCSAFEVINFHYSYLPYYRGMNIPTWVIYNRESFTGITWHFVTDVIDGGKIITQKKIYLTEDTTAFEITYQGMRLGIATFKDFIFDLLEKPIEGSKICKEELGIIYLSNKLPNNGYLDLTNSFDDIYKMLRSFDYGKSGVLSPLRVIYDNQDYYVSSYKKIAKERETLLNENEIIINGKKFDLKITVKKDRSVII